MEGLKNASYYQVHEVGFSCWGWWGGYWAEIIVKGLKNSFFHIDRGCFCGYHPVLCF